MLSVYVVCWIFLQTFQTYFCIQANSVDSGQTAPGGAVWSGSTLFAKMTKQMTNVVIGSSRVKNEHVHFTIWKCVLKLVDKWQTV